MIAFFVIAVLIIVDMFTKRRDNLHVTRLLCVVTPALLLIYPPIVNAFLFSQEYAALKSNLWLVAALTLAICYLCLRVMISKHDYLPLSHKALSLSGLGLRYNIAALLSFLISFILLIVVLFYSLDKLLGMYTAYILLLLLAFIAICTIVLAPIGLLVIFLVIGRVLLNSAIFTAIGVASAFILAVSIVLGIRAVRAAASTMGMSKKVKVSFIVFMCFPIANIITLLILRRSIKKHMSKNQE